MNRGIIFFLGSVIVLGLAALYALSQGPVLLLKGPKEDRIAFVSDRGGQVDIWTMRPDGSDVRPVTNDAADDQIPTWSPDGKELAAISDRRSQVYQVFLSAWDGRYTHDLTISEGIKDVPVWTADGTELSFLNGGRIFTVGRSGGREEQLLPSGDMAAIDMGRMQYIYGAWSPDKQTLLCVMETDLGQVVSVISREELESGESPAPKSVVGARSIYAAWAPSGKKIAVSFIGRNGKNGIAVADLESMKSQDLFIVNEDKEGPGKVVWSPDGKTLAFESWTVEEGMPNRSRGIYTISASGGKPKLVAEGDAREPSWSPDSRKIAYTGIAKDDRRSIWCVDADGTGAVNLTEDKGDSYNPAWSPARKR